MTPARRSGAGATSMDSTPKEAPGLDGTTDERADVDVAAKQQVNAALREQLPVMLAPMLRDQAIMRESLMQGQLEMQKNFQQLVKQATA